MIIKLIILFYLYCITPLFAFADMEARKITPPKLDEVHLGQKIECYRPMRQGSPNMSIEVINNKVIAHNYGHGGSGWTLAPGSAGHVNNLLIKSENAKTLHSDTPITIVGAGILGLFTAYDFIQKGFNNLTIIADKFEGLTSHNAGGLLAPVSMDNKPEMQKTMDEIGIEAYKLYASIANKKHPHFKDGAIIVPTYFENRESSGLEPYVGHVMQPAKDVILDFQNGTQRTMVVYDDGIFIDTAKLMTSLNHYLRNKKVKFIQRKINSFSEVQDNFIINCAGLGAGKLNNDNQVLPVQGHLIMLKNQNIKDLQYMILVYFDESRTKSGQKVKRSFYLFPKHLANSQANDIGVIGGTFIENATPDTPNREEFNILLQGAKEFYGIK